MKKETTTHGLSLKKVVELLNIGSDVGTDRGDTDQDKTDLLNDRLSQTLPLYEDEPRKKSKQLSRTIAVLSGEPIGKLLQDPKTELSIIKVIKEHGRKLADRSKSEAEHQVANTIYFAAIAHALVFKKETITRFSKEDLRQAFDRVSQENWIPEWLLELFAQASHRIQSAT
ncbi:MAG: hypothetical protein JXN61_11595 [Sedimentisphaerales bacterium]|nr:hypothetical protein [Sedimentisphaerales bacterium]